MNIIHLHLHGVQINFTMGFTLTRSVSPEPFTRTTLVSFSELEPEFSYSFEELDRELESRFHLCVELELRQFFCFWFFPFYVWTLNWSKL
jgi:hypothetical protein